MSREVEKKCGNSLLSPQGLGCLLSAWVLSWTGGPDLRPGWACHAVPTERGTEEQDQADLCFTSSQWASLA